MTLIAVCGVDPNTQLTPRQMLHLAKERRKNEWDHTAHLMAIIVNSNPFRTGQPVSPSMFNPVRKGVDVEMTLDEYRAEWYRQEQEENNGDRNR